MDAVIIVVGVAESCTGGALLAGIYSVPTPAILKLVPAIHLLLVDERHLRMDQVVIACLMLLILVFRLVDEHLNEVSAKLFIWWCTFRRSVGLFSIHDLV